MPTPGVESTGPGGGKFLKSKITITGVYVLIGASTVIYLALLQFWNSGSSTGGQFDTAYYNQSSSKTQMVGLAKVVAQYRTGTREIEQEIGALPQACHGPFSCTKPLCPDSDIPGLVGQRKLNLSEISIAHAEEQIFGPSAGKVRTSVKRANEILLKKLVDPKTGKITNVDWLFDQVLDPDAMNISNYWYLPGGHWKPMNCLPRWKVAILIPFRNRFQHLPIILQYLTPMLQKQLLEFSFFIVEQANQELFNRAMLMNVGFLESLNFTDYDCFVIHDVDHVPIDERNYYGCSSMPRHFISGSDRWNYKLPYKDFFGAVTGLTKANIRSINGFPNVYWGWGGEDDEIYRRVMDAHLKITRDKGDITQYNVIKHHHKSAPAAKDRLALLSTYKRRNGMDGLSNIVYPTPVYDLHTLYTNVSVDIKRIKPHHPTPAPKAGKLAKKITIAGPAMKGGRKEPKTSGRK
ncbi:beta-1,4-galactosyltransferase 5-like [Strongylocentrotus purpuratus]|uniref:Beta-1,4-galactosyltransferase n=1 Tax=Strongylocentrotus purpuratus TaxID=7668 RepID=A0A7M7NEB0_STRPU|nr:beta-1,4-galactosyltransferase 5-like [Strongylocentrotus purpuratus]